jgi:hypothetical protein
VGDPRYLLYGLHERLRPCRARVSTESAPRAYRHGRPEWVDDVVSVQPWNVRGIEIRGAIEIMPMGGSALGPGFDAEMFRLRPKRIVSWGIDGTMMQQNARSVG